MNNLIIRTTDSLIRVNQFSKSNIEELLINIDQEENNVDIWIDTFIRTGIKTSFDNIFIPASIGQTKADFLGFRVALHIRTTPENPSQRSNLIIYGPATLSEIARYSNLYKLVSTKGIFLIDYSKEAIREKLNEGLKLDTEDDLTEELGKLDLAVPEQYYDSHSIANLWGAYSLCKTANIRLKDIPSLEKNLVKLKSVYFKWLLTINNIEMIRNEDVEENERVSNKKLAGTTFKGMIDLTKIPKR